MPTLYINIYINENGKIQYLTEVLPMIPKNVILYKKLTGLGATFGEIKADRNSIILEPNVPVIEGKCSDLKHKDDNLFGVYEGVYTDAVIDYIQQTQQEGKRIKILTTPESFQKVKNAFEELEINMHYECFMLFDECHKIVKDVDYRTDITLPMDDFFEFEEKALVSATPLRFTDPRFEEQGFSIIEIVPQFDYTQKINLLHTNNVLQAIKEVLKYITKNRTEERSICFFINSTDMILSFIKQLKIEKDSFVFCADKSVEKLKEQKFMNASSRWNKSLMKKYNFFTSRFFNAVDIELDEKPDIILVSEVYYAGHSALDPRTDSIQAIGRFRNGVSYKFHVYNTNKDFPFMPEEEIEEYIKTGEAIYTAFQGYYNSATTVGARNSYKAALDSLPYNKFLLKDGRKNYFAIDNHIDEILLKGFYSDRAKVLNTYENTKIFIPVFKYKYWPLGDFERMKRENKSLPLKEKRRIIVEQLELLGEIETSLHKQYRDELYFADRLIVDAYETIGKEKIEKLKYSTPKIEEAMILHRFENHPRGAELKELIYNSFKDGMKYTLEEIKKELKRFHDLLGIRSAKAITAQTIKDYFIVAPSEKRKNGKRALLLIARKF